MPDRVNSAATSRKPIWSSPTWGLCPSRASLPHKVKPFLLLYSLTVLVGKSSLSGQSFGLTQVYFLQILHEGDCLSRAWMVLFWPEWRNIWGGSKDLPSWLVNKWYDVLCKISAPYCVNLVKQCTAMWDGVSITLRHTFNSWVVYRMTKSPMGYVCFFLG